MYGFCFFKQKTAYEMRISDWSSDVCSSDLGRQRRRQRDAARPHRAVAFGQRGRAVAGVLGGGGKRGHVPSIIIPAERRMTTRSRRVGALPVQWADVTCARCFSARKRRICVQDRKSTRLNSSH